MTRAPRATPVLPHVEIKLRLPPLSGEQALLLTNLLDDLIAALWNVHGEAMLDQIADLGLREHDVGGSAEHLLPSDPPPDDIPF